MRPRGLQAKPKARHVTRSRKSLYVHAAYNTIFLSENLQTRDELVTFRLEDRIFFFFYKSRKRREQSVEVSAWLDPNYQRYSSLNLFTSELVFRQLSHFSQNQYFQSHQYFHCNWKIIRPIYFKFCTDFLETFNDEPTSIFCLFNK